MPEKTKSGISSVMATLRGEFPVEKRQRDKIEKTRGRHVIYKYNLQDK